MIWNISFLDMITFLETKFLTEVGNCSKQAIQRLFARSCKCPTLLLIEHLKRNVLNQAAEGMNRSTQNSHWLTIDIFVIENCHSQCQFRCMSSTCENIGMAIKCIVNATTESNFKLKTFHRHVYSWLLFTWLHFNIYLCGTQFIEMDVCVCVCVFVEIQAFIFFIRKRSAEAMKIQSIATALAKTCITKIVDENL